MSGSSADDVWAKPFEIPGARVRDLGAAVIRPGPLPMRQSVFALALALGACARPEPAPPRGDSARHAFGDTVAAMLLDTTLYELRAQLFVKIPNPNRDDESPLADQPFDHPATPGPHTLDGKLYAELGALQSFFGSSLPVRVAEFDRVYVGSPPVLLMGHKHGDAMYVPVKLFARQYGAYTDVGCTLANCGHIWPRSVIELMMREGFVHGAGILEGHAEGIVKNIDVTKRPSG